MYSFFRRDVRIIIIRCIGIYIYIYLAIWGLRIYSLRKGTLLNVEGHFNR